VVDVEGSPDDVAAHQCCWVNGKAPVSAEAVDSVARGIELVNLPVLEHAGIAVAQVLAHPNVLILVRIAPAVVLHFVAQHVWEPRIVGVVDYSFDSTRR
jgi:hypothetical protein